MLTPADLRAEAARHRVPLYRIAGTIGLHPGRLGSMLNERIPMPADVAQRVSEAITKAASAEQRDR